MLRDFWQETQVDSCSYDLSRKFTAESYQEMMEVNALTMGDGLTAFRWDKDGWPAVRVYDALSADNLLKLLQHTGVDQRCEVGSIPVKK